LTRPIGQTANEAARRILPPGGLGEAPVYLRAPDREDAPEFLGLMLRSRSLHHPWIQPPITEAGFDAYLRRMARQDHSGFLVCRRDNHAIAGVININNVVHGAFLSGSLGYYSTAVQQVVRIAFEALGLHRLEANIQPGNARSIGLVRRLGFRREGFSPAYLYIDGAWRDHERWALVAERDTLLPPGVPDEVARRVP
jgi:ribosomal-protein-alanine N-acetyltransferase